MRSHFERLSPVQKNIALPRRPTTGERRETPHRKPRSPKVISGLSGAGWTNNVADLDFILTADAKEALILENQLIKKYKPKYNIQWRDDKSYFWVSFSNDEWPRVLITHRLKIENCKLKISPIIGPFTNGTELKQVLRSLRKILPYRTCKNAYNKPCLQWHLGLCPTHENRLSPIAYRQSLNTLTQLLRLYANEPLRVEAYDISNIQGASATGSMIVFKGSKPDKSQYRKFRIKTVAGANDIAMLKEVLRRRLNHTEWLLPDLILIDGGRAQLCAAVAALNAKRLALSVIALAKKEDELYTVYSNKTLRLSALPINLQLTIQAIRDEAHRFAISYYRKLHRKNIRK